MIRTQGDFDINRQMFLEWLRLHNARKGDKVTIIVNPENSRIREMKISGTIKTIYFGWIHTDRYGRRKSGYSGGASWRVAVLEVLNENDNTSYEIKPQEIAKITFEGNSSRRRTNPYNKICDFTEDFRRKYSLRTRNIRPMLSDMRGDTEYRVMYNGKPCGIGLLQTSKDGYTVELIDDSRERGTKISAQEFIELPVVKREA